MSGCLSILIVIHAVERGFGVCGTCVVFAPVPAMGQLFGKKPPQAQHSFPDMIAKRKVRNDLESSEAGHLINSNPSAIMI